MDGQELINMDGGHGAFESHESMNLKKGLYKISQRYFQMDGGLINKVSWKGAGIPKEEIPAEYLFHEEQ